MKSYDQPRQYTKKQRHYLTDKVLPFKVMVFPVVTYVCESWTIKKPECRSIDNFELWCWRRLLRVSWTSKIKPVNPKGNQSWIFIGRIDAEAPILWPPDVKSRLIEKDPNAGKDWRQRRRRQQKIRWLDSIIDSMDTSLSLKCCSPWGCKELTWLSDWTTILARGASLVA